MATFTLKICHICFAESIPVSEAVFYQCGHYACQQCAEGLYRGMKLCGECRRPKGKCHRIYLTADDIIMPNTNQAKTEIAAAVGSKESATASEESFSNRNDQKSFVNGLVADSGLNGPSLNLDDIRKAYQNGMQAVEDEYGNEMQAVKDELQAVKDRMQAANDKIENKVQDLTDKFEAINDFFGYVTPVVQGQVDEIDRLQTRSQGYLALFRQKEAENLALQEELKKRDKKYKLMKTKIKALIKMSKKGSADSLEEGSTSLQIEDVEPFQFL